MVKAGLRIVAEQLTVLVDVGEWLKMIYDEVRCKANVKKLPHLYDILGSC
jgi:hypothetical protein